MRMTPIVSRIVTWAMVSIPISLLSACGSRSAQSDQTGWYPETMAISGPEKSGDLSTIDATYENDDTGGRIRGLWSFLTANAWHNPSPEGASIHVHGMPGGMLEAELIQDGRIERKESTKWEPADGGLRHQESHLMIAVVENYSVDFTDRMYLCANGDLVATENGHDFTLFFWFGGDSDIQRRYRFRRIGSGAGPTVMAPSPAPHPPK